MRLYASLSYSNEQALCGRCWGVMAVPVLGHMVQADMDELIQRGTQRGTHASPRYAEISWKWCRQIVSILEGSSEGEARRVHRMHYHNWLSALLGMLLCTLGL